MQASIGKGDEVAFVAKDDDRLIEQGGADGLFVDIGGIGDRMPVVRERRIQNILRARWIGSVGRHSSRSRPSAME
jgi:hypothetical protein